MAKPQGPQAASGKKQLTAASTTAAARRATRQPPAVKAPQDRGLAFVEKVFHAVLAALADDGFDALSIPDVAERAGVNKTSIYRRWPQKVDLVRDAVTAMMELVVVPPSSSGALRADLVTLGQALAAFLQSPAGAGAMRLLMSHSGDPATVALIASIGPLQALLGPRAILEAAVARGELRADVDSELVLFTLAGAVLHRAMVERRELDRAWLERVVDLLLTGAAVNAAAAPSPAPMRRP